MNSLLVIGAGSFSTEIDELARLLGYTDIAFVDDNPDNARCNPVVGTMKDIPELRKRYDSAIVALGNNENRMKFHNILKACTYDIPILVHPTAYVSPDAILSSGCIVRTNAVISRYVKLGESVIVNVGALIDHDCIIENGCHILMGAVVRNKVRVPAGTWIASNQVYEDYNDGTKEERC